MASTISAPNTIQAFSLNQARNHHAPSRNAEIPKSTLISRRNLLYAVTAAPALTLRDAPAKAQDIPLFGLRKKLKNAEKEAEELVKEGFETAEKGLETAERGIKTAEEGIETAEKEIEEAVKFGGLPQAGAVVGAEFIGVLVASSIVNGILGPEAQKS
ncbi:uncharacterized protein LOC126655210 [Mercurialis annua]|uniref:uncharacterized protein LOC126655210 n=1 Tax=Mercurialis annua TaxID=3986 RepID=UPI00216074DF|nr:uncharacterized protein LOC126655210 [Mercurialis annua]